LLSISSRGELAVLTGSRYVAHAFFSGTLARMDMGGGAPREILQNVQDADWTPDGAGLAIIREVNGMSRLEYPIGKVLWETAGYVSNLRFSPRGDQIAFFDHPARYDDRGSIDVVDLQGHRRVLSSGYTSQEGLAWGADGNTVYFSAQGKDDSHLLIRAVTLGAKTRTVLSSGQDLWILDAGVNGRLLVIENNHTSRLMALAPGAKAERDLSWLDYSSDPCFSSDGEEILFSEEGTVAGTNYALVLRKTNGSPVLRLGDGIAMGLSPDGDWALSIVPGPPAQLVLYPTGPGEMRVLERGDIEYYDSARFFSNGKRILTCGNEPGHATRCYVQDVAGGAPRPITPEGTAGGITSPEGKEVLVRNSGGRFFIYSLAGGSPSAVQGLTPEDVVIRWSKDGGSFFVFGNSQVPAQVERVDISTGRRTIARELAPVDRAGVLQIRWVALADDGESYAYSYARNLSQLNVVEGVK
jgi:Tol biopolymer transport system component